MNNQHPKSVSNLEEIFQKAIKLHENNELERACKCYQEILAEIPESSLVNYNLGLALYELDRFEQSLACYSTALKEAPNEKDLLYNYGLCCQKLSRRDEAIAAYRKVLTISHDDIDALYNLGCCYMEDGDIEKAETMYNKVLKIDESHTSAMYNLACLLHESGRLDQAEKRYITLLKLRPDHHSAKHLLASIHGEISSKPPTDYIIDTFNNFSAHYDESLTRKLEYELPDIARHLFTQLSQKKTAITNTLDLGCGTGLSGIPFADFSSKLVGVDLSPEMVAQAKRKNIYNELYVNEIEEFIDQCGQSFECILALDTFPYFGSLSPLFHKIQKVAQKKCLFCFSIEKGPSYPYTLQKSGRYAHTTEYIQEILHVAGWKVKLVRDINLRKERGEWILGALFFAVPL